jgi:regulator of protease activity HflC (stomatin/prohibitin superfamily)
MVGDILFVALSVGVVCVLLVWLTRRVIRRVVILDYERGLKFTNGKLSSVLGPGGYFFNPVITKIVVHDLRPRIEQVPGQEVLSADGVSLKVSLMAKIAIADVELVQTGAEDYSAAAYAVFQSRLREAIGGHPIDEILQRRQALSERLFEAARPEITALGLDLQSLEIKDIMFPGPLKQLFAKVADARLEGLASLERARGESAALRNLANSASLFKEHPGLLQLRLVQAMTESSGHTFALGDLMMDPGVRPRSGRQDDD